MFAKTRLPYSMLPEDHGNYATALFFFFWGGGERGEEGGGEWGEKDKLTRRKGIKMTY